MNNSAKKEVLRTKTRAMFPFLIEITHPDYGVFRYANSDIDLEFEGNVFTASFFSISPPKKDGESIGNASLTISSIDQFWVGKIRGTNKTANLRFIAAYYMDSNNDLVFEDIQALDDIEFTLRQVSWNETAITWEMESDDTMNILVPVDKATPQKCPSCA